MKQKYHIWKNVNQKQLHIDEYAVTSANAGRQKMPGLQSEDFSLLCQQSYASADVAAAITKGKESLILLLRNSHFFPTGLYMDKIADQVIAMYALQGEQHDDLVLDDKDVLAGMLVKSDEGSADEALSVVQSAEKIKDPIELVEEESQ